MKKSTFWILTTLFVIAGLYFGKLYSRELLVESQSLCNTNLVDVTVVKKEGLGYFISNGEKYYDNSVDRFYYAPYTPEKDSCTAKSKYLKSLK